MFSTYLQWILCFSLIIAIQTNQCWAQGEDSLSGDTWGYYHESYTKNIEDIEKKLIRYFKNNPEIESAFSFIKIKPEGEVSTPQKNKILFESKSPVSDESRLEIERIICEMEIYFIEEKGYNNISNHIYIENMKEKVKVVINGYDYLEFQKEKE